MALLWRAILPHTELMPTDFRDNKAYPRSGRHLKGRFMWLLRVYDKARAKAAGTHFGYIYPCPIDRGMMKRWGITPSEFNAAIAAHKDDASIYAWLEPRVSDEAIDRANKWLVEKWTANLDRQDGEERGGAII